MAADPNAGDGKENDYVTISLKDDKSKETISEVKIHTFGATVVSWKVKGSEKLFLSKFAKLDGTKAIRGGIPLVFPQFGPGAMKQHGFARAMRWSVKENSLKESSVTLVLKNNDATTKDPWNWQHKFCLEYTVSLNKDKPNAMENSLKIDNNNDASDNGKGSFDFTVLFHNYFSVTNVKDVKLDGLPSCEYLIDKVTKNTTNYKELVNTGVTVDKATDSVFANHSIKNSSVTILNGNDKNKNETIVVTRGNLMKDIVVWNPWSESAKGMSDFGDNEYNNMVCVEVGSVTKDSQISLDAGKSCVVSQVLSVV